MTPPLHVDLRTARLRLRAPEDGDAAELLAMHASTEVMRWSNGLPWTSIEQAHGLVRSARSWAESGRHLCLCVAESATGRVVGTVTLYDIDRAHRRAEVGFLLAASVWRRGYMAEALTALLDHAFRHLELNRIEADTDPRNGGAIALLESLGFGREGLLRQRWWVGGQAVDSALFGLLRADWDARPAGVQR